MLLTTLAAAALTLAPLGAPVAAAQPCTAAQIAAGTCTLAPTTTVIPPVTTTTPTTTVAPTTTPVTPQDAAIAQICLATSIDEIDEALADLAESDLVGRLGGLVDLLVVDDADNITVVGAVQPGDVQRALNCDPDDSDVPTTTPPPGVDDDGGQIGGDGNGGSSVIPDGAPQTGGRPPADPAPALVVLALLGPALLAAQIRYTRP